MTYLQVLTKGSKAKTTECIPEITYLEAFKITKQLPTKSYNHCDISLPYISKLYIQKKPVELTDIPYFKGTQRRGKNKPPKFKKPTFIPKFLIFILLPFFPKLSKFYEVLLPNSFKSNDMYSCIVCHLVAKYWKSPGHLTTYNCHIHFGRWVFKTACCKQCSKLGNLLESKKLVHG